MATLLLLRGFGSLLKIITSNSSALHIDTIRFSETLGLVWFEQKIGVFCIHFQFLWDPLLKNLFSFIFVFSFHFQYPKNRIWIQKLNTAFWYFYFLKNKCSDIFIKKPNLWILLTLTCPIKKHTHTHNLSLSLN